MSRERRMASEYQLLQPMPQPQPAPEAPVEPQVEEISLPEAPRRPVVLAICKDSQWAYGNIGRALQRHLGDEFEVRVGGPTVGLLDPTPADVAIVFTWQFTQEAAVNQRPRRIVMGVYDAAAHRAGMAHFRACARRATVVATANDAISKDIESLRTGRPVFTTEDGVDTEMFAPTPLPEAFAVGWAGNSEASLDGDLKGIWTIRDACALAGARLETADAAVARRPHAEMPAFYRGVSVYVCASTAEGTPNPVLEAAACGRPVISTHVGIAKKIVAHGESGFLVPRDPRAIAAAIDQVRSMSPEARAAMGARARERAIAFDWRLKAEPWRACLRAALA